MRIKHVEIHNYKRLSNCRIEFGASKTLFVGANNSGKTSAMKALIQFLGEEKGFSLYDFTASNWLIIDSIGDSWLAGDNGQTWGKDFLALDTWDSILPSLDIWIHVDADELQFIPSFIPSLAWNGEPIGLRILLNPESGQRKIENLAKDFISAKRVIEKVHDASGDLMLWPESLSDFLKGKKSEGLVGKYFSLSVYLLDSEKSNCDDKQEVIKVDISSVRSQVPLSHNDLKKLFQVDYIEAQRGFTDTNKGSLLTDQFRKYYDEHLDIKESPDMVDIKFLKLLQDIEINFGLQLSNSFNKPLTELGNLGYPGFYNPTPMLNVKLSTFEGLNHNSAVEHTLCGGSPIRLPEFSNGLGYQNLISMTFALMSFRDSWMRVGKRIKSATSMDTPFPRLHLVLIEEPEAHLHAQVQRVFVERAYATLRNHELLKDSGVFTTQLAISTHSSYIVKGSDFCDLRYFRRVMNEPSQAIPFSTVVNMNDTFSPSLVEKKKIEIEKVVNPSVDTRRFATRYIRSTHCDLFFADAIILVEGNAERMLLPRFIKKQYPNLDGSYLSILEIGGSHAHRILPLIKKLGLPCLIITDLDPTRGEGHHIAVQPKRGEGQITANATLKEWFHSGKTIKTIIDELLEAYGTDSVISKGECPIRIAYQGPIKVSNIDDVETEYLPYTFEEALIIDNLDVFKNSLSDSVLSYVKMAIEASSSVETLSDNLYDLIQGPRLEEGGKRGN